MCVYIIVHAYNYTYVHLLTRTHIHLELPFFSFDRDIPLEITSGRWHDAD